MGYYCGIDFVTQLSNSGMRLAQDIAKQFKYKAWFSIFGANKNRVRHD